MSTINFNVGGDFKKDTPTLIADNPPGGTTLESHFEGVDGEAPNRFIATVPSDITGGAWLTYRDGRFRVILPPGVGSWEASDPKCFPPEYGTDLERVALHYRQAYATLPPLSVVGRYFRQNGNRMFLNGATGFNVPGRFVYEGADALRPMLAQRQAAGFNAIRLWSAYNIPLIGRLIPRDVPNFYADVIPAVSALCAEYGQYPYWTGLTGPYSVTLGGQAQIIEHDALMQMALYNVPYALYDRRNEYSKDVNQVSGLPDLRLPPLRSQGSGQQDEDPPTPLGTFYARHPDASKGEWQRKVGKQNMDYAEANGVNIPGVDDETIRCEPSGDTDLNHYQDAGGCAVLFAAGAFLHSALAKLGIPWDGREWDAALAWCVGVQRIINQGLDIAQEGKYYRRDDMLTPGLIRVYERRLDESIFHPVRE